MQAYLHQNGRIPFNTIACCFIIIFLSISTVIAQEDTIIVGTGWNMVGALYNGPVMDIIRTEPAGIMSSEFFGYNPVVGYESKDTLKKGYGYWVKVSDNGILIFGSTAEWVCGNTLEYSGKIYNTVQIASQCWLKENLDVGTMILVNDIAKDNGITEKYCYNDSIENCSVYGGLYQWNEAMQYTTTPGVRGICPVGWHIPSLTEFETLNNTVGSDGNALKAIGQGIEGGAGTNTSGFSALLAGYRYDYGGFGILSYNAYLWSSTEYISTYAYFMVLELGSNFIGLGYGFFKDYGFSVRCLKD